MDTKAIVKLAGQYGLHLQEAVIHFTNYKTIFEWKGEPVTALQDDLFLEQSLGKTVAIGNHRISFYNDHSGPRYCLWLDNGGSKEDWQKQPEVNPKLNKKPERYHLYTGSHFPNKHQWRGRNRMSHYLVPNNDLNRHYTGTETLHLADVVKQIQEEIDEWCRAYGS